MTDDAIKKPVERGVAESFLCAYNKVHSVAFAIKEASEAPDFVCQDEQTKTNMGLEITTAYYSNEDAELTWRLLRHQSERESGSVTNPEAALVRFLEDLIDKKLKKNYGYGSLLAIHVEASLTTAGEFEERILPVLDIKPGNIALQGIFVRMKGDICEPPIVWWQVYPEKRRFYECQKA